MAKTKISWAERVWNPVIGCSKVSVGCDNCYAENMAKRLYHIEKEDGGYYKDLGCYNGWNGKVITIPDRLNQPLHWRKPSRIFVCSMGDLFHENVRWDFIDAVIAMIILNRRHQFLILTKRPDRMLDYFKDVVYERLQESYGSITDSCMPIPISDDWPIKNLWLGVSVEHPDYLWRIEELLKIPAAVRFVSFEPLLGDIDLDKYLWFDPSTNGNYKKEWGMLPAKDLHWVIVGGESGSKRRVCKTAWIWNIVDQCKDAGVPCFVKQIHINGKVSKNMDEWLLSLRVQEYPA